MDISGVHRRTIAPGLPSTLIELPAERVLSRLSSLSLPRDVSGSVYGQRFLPVKNPFLHSFWHKFRRILKGATGEFMFQFTKYIQNGSGIECLPVSSSRRRVGRAKGCFRMELTLHIPSDLVKGIVYYLPRNGYEHRYEYN